MISDVDAFLREIELEHNRLKCADNTMFNSAEQNMDTVIGESIRVADIAHNADSILDGLDEEFENTSKLDKVDVAFLFLAIGLQIARQYLLSNEKCRLTASQGDKVIEKTLSLAPPDWQDILTQSVPYDAIKTGEHVSNTGLAGTTHRYRTLGHDPILGWIFGTSNIMTNSLTKTDLETYQVKNMQIVRHYPMGAPGMLERAVTYSEKDPKLLAVSVARQAIHFGSDYFTKQGLPVPFLASINNDLAKKMLSEWHIDMWSITRGAALSTFINSLISIMHRLFCPGQTEIERKLYEVKTSKILMYSNLVASGTNLAVVGVTRDLKLLDVGGLGVTIYRLITDRTFIRNVKYEFIYGSFNHMIQGDPLDLEDYSYDEILEKL